MGIQDEQIVKLENLEEFRIKNTQIRIGKQKLKNICMYSVTHQNNWYHCVVVHTHMVEY